MAVAMDGEKVHRDCARRRMSDVTESVRVLTEPRVQHALTFYERLTHVTVQYSYCFESVVCTERTSSPPEMREPRSTREHSERVHACSLCDTFE